MKPPFRFAFPARGSGARLPALLAVVLAGMAALQPVLQPAAPEPAPAVVSGGHVVRAVPDPAPVIATAAGARTLPFSPAPTAAAGAASTPLAGAVIAGTVRIGGVPFAMVQMPDGSIRRVGIGARVAGWRLAALLPGGARLVRDGDTITPAYGHTLAGMPAPDAGGAQEGSE